MPCLTHWSCEVGHHSHTEPAPAQGPAQLRGPASPGTPGYGEGRPETPLPHSSPTYLSRPCVPMCPGDMVSLLLSVAILLRCLVVRDLVTPPISP